VASRNLCAPYLVTFDCYPSAVAFQLGGFVQFHHVVGGAADNTRSSVLHSSLHTLKVLERSSCASGVKILQYEGSAITVQLGAPGFLVSFVAMV
jgi:hypothetical protein